MKHNHLKDNNYRVTMFNRLIKRMSIPVIPYSQLPCQLFLWEETGVPGENEQRTAER